MNVSERKRYPLYFVAPALFVFALFFVIPTLLGFYYSFTDWDIDKSTISFVGFDNFAYLLKRDIFLKAFRNTVYFGVATGVTKNVLGLLLALAVNRDLKTKNYLRTMFYLPGVLSMIVVGIMFNSILSIDGLLNNFMDIIGLGAMTTDWLGDINTAMNSVVALEVWKWAGFHMIIYLAGLQSIPETLLEAATVDGAGKVSKFFRVTLPLLMPSVTINIVISLIGGFKVFEQVYILTNGGPGNHTQVLNTLVFQAFSQGLYGRGSAMGLILFIFISLCSILMNKYLRSKEVEM